MHSSLGNRARLCLKGKKKKKAITPFDANIAYMLKIYLKEIIPNIGEENNNTKMFIAALLMIVIYSLIE